MGMTSEFMGWVLLALVIILGWVMIRFILAALPSIKPEKNWPSVEGIVYISMTNAWTDSNGEELSEPAIRCVYRVNHVDYNLTLDGPRFLKCTWREWENVARYWPKQFTVRVRYDPQKPRRAVVEPAENPGWAGS